MNTPSALDRFQKVIVSKRPGKCFFCATTTLPDSDYAALDAFGKWQGVCALHASSVVEQCKALTIRIVTEATDPAVRDQIDKLVDLLPAPIETVLEGAADARSVLATVQTLTLCVTLVDGAKPAPVRSNKFAGKCGTCGGKVAEGAGRIERNDDGKWITFHLDGQCVTTAAPVAEAAVVVPDGRYAVRSDEGDVRFYRVENGSKGGKWEGYTFVSAQASDDLYPIKNRNSRKVILDAIAADPQGAAALYGKELGVCGRCGKTLTDEASRASGIGPVCANKAW